MWSVHASSVETEINIKNRREKKKKGVRVDKIAKERYKVCLGPGLPKGKNVDGHERIS